MNVKISKINEELKKPNPFTNKDKLKQEKDELIEAIRYIDDVLFDII